MLNKKNIIIVTGAANGIAKQIALDLDLNSNIICLFDKDEKILKLKSLFKKAKSEVFVGDVLNENDIKNFLNLVIKKYKKIDTLINAAAVVPYKMLADTETEFFANTINVNLVGYFIFCREVSSYMKKRKNGVIVNISSISSFMGISGQVSYASSKGGINALTKVLAVELGVFNIRVNAVAPGSILVERNKKSMNTKEYLNRMKNIVPLGRIGNPKDVSGVVKFLISKDSSYVSGQVIVVDGGMTSKL